MFLYRFLTGDIAEKKITPAFARFLALIFGGRPRGRAPTVPFTDTVSVPEYWRAATRARPYGSVY
jgi:hypothetical protein